MEEAKPGTCPGCQATIPLEDINVAKDLALCRGCGQTWAFSAVRSSAELASVELHAPPKHVRIDTDSSGAQTITYRRISPLVLFLIPFTAIWSGGSLLGIYGTQIKKGKFDALQSLFGLPFLIGTILLVSVILFLLFGKWVIRIRPGEIEVFAGVGAMGWRRRARWEPGALVSLEDTQIRTNRQIQQAIVISQHAERLLSFGATIHPRETKLFIAAAIRRALLGG